VIPITAVRQTNLRRLTVARRVLLGDGGWPSAAMRPLRCRIVALSHTTNNR
jgi:hypothetical protein